MINTQIVIATYNGEQFNLLTKCLDSLTLVKSEYNFKVIISDNNSDNIEHLNFLEKIRQKNHSYPFEISVVTNKRRGFDTGAFKYAIAEVINTADYYIFIHDDIEFCQNSWDKTFIEKFEEGQKTNPKVLYTAFCGQNKEFNPHWNQISWVEKWLETNESNFGNYNCFGDIWFINNENLKIILQSEYYQVLNTRFFPITHKGDHVEALETGFAAMAHRMGYTINWITWRDRGGLGPDHIDGRYHAPGWYPLYHTMAKVTTTRPHNYTN
jgi:hypothetical protein